ncbi:MAG: 4-hydroxythreonine-4-phosphate dehydrogenase PdxA [Pseudomonadota bacterium]
MSQEKQFPPLAITMGEPGGVGGELTLKAWRALKDDPTAVFFAIDDPARLRALAARLNLTVDVNEVSAPGEASKTFPNALPVMALDAPVSSDLGVASPQTADAVKTSIETATRLSLAGAAAGVVTNPIQKSALAAAGFPFPGHTEYIADLVKDTPLTGPRGPVMMLAGSGLRAVPATIHIPLKEVSKALTTDLIANVARVTAAALHVDFAIPAPRLAIAGLNPHAGEAGVLGTEDADIIAPAVATLNGEGIAAEGPLPADTMFHDAARADYDAAICMYHDQALIPVKTIDFFGTANVTLGLPVVRTSPDHGTALNIAGKGLAHPESLIAAIRLARDIARRRAANG